MVLLIILGIAAVGVGAILIYRNNQKKADAVVNKVEDAVDAAKKAIK